MNPITNQAQLTTPGSPTSFLTALLGRMRTIVQRAPLSLRGMVLIGLATYLLCGPVVSKSDIVSAALAYGLIALVASVFMLVTIGAYVLRARPLCYLTGPAERATSRIETRVIVSVRALRVPPGTWLEIAPLFAHEQPNARTLRISGASRFERKLPLDITFNHRGAWDITALRCSLRDITGLVRYSWSIPYSDAITVYPATISDTTLPLLSSTQRPGDAMTDTLNRHGDPFDIKPYHPSDGIKKIVWKAFAKSGELLSRHPEASMTPEGFVTIITLARPQDDDICSKVVAYTRALEELKLDLLVTCEGARGRSLARSAQECEELLVESVWDAALSRASTLESDANALLDWCARASGDVTVRKMLLFVSGARLADSNEAARITALATWLSAQGIEPVFCVSEPAAHLKVAKAGYRQQATSLFITPSETPSSLTDARDYRAFLTNCLSHNWEVFV